MPDNDESFLNRWARRKAAVREESTRDGKPDQEAAPGAADAAHLQSDGGQDTVAKSDTGEAEAAEAAPGEETAAAEPVETFDDVDFDALDYDSDYARFMGSKVPDDVRNKALRKLWMSNPVLTHMDGLDDYIEDYTDAAVAVPMGLLKTGYKVGQGFLSNEEAAEWDALGRPEPEVASGEGDTVAPAAAAIAIADESPDQVEVAAFLAASDAYHAGLYPAESNHMVDVATLQGPQTSFVVARREGAAIGCGAVVVHAAVDEAPAYGELKRMWVVPEARGTGLGRALLAALEARAADRGAAVVRLETGIRQPEALRLYTVAGYEQCGPFGSYQPDPLSVFLERWLVAQPAGDHDESVRVSEGDQADANAASGGAAAEPPETL